MARLTTRSIRSFLAIPEGDPSRSPFAPERHLLDWSLRSGRREQVGVSPAASAALLEQRGAAQTALEVVLEAAEREPLRRAPWWGRAARRARPAARRRGCAGPSARVSGSMRRPAKRPHVAQSTPPSSRSNAVNGPVVVAAAGARSSTRVEALEREQLPEERRAHQRGRVLGERAQRADEHAVQRGVGLALLSDLVGGLEHRDRVREAAVVLPERPVGVDGLGLGDDVELAARGSTATRRGSSARAGRRTGSPACARPSPPPGPCRGPG